jgi:hypothetical protein
VRQILGGGLRPDSAITDLYARLDAELSPDARAAFAGARQAVSDDRETAATDDPASADREGELRGSVADLFPATGADGHLADAAVFILAYGVQQDIAARVDRMTDLGERGSLRLQVAKARWSECMSIIANIFRRLANVEAGIVKKLK